MQVIHQLHSLDHFKRVVANPAPCVIEFTAENSASCSYMSAQYHKLSRSYPELTFYSVDGQKQPDIAREAGIVVLPTFTFFDNGIFEDVVVGEDARNLKQTMSLFCPTPVSSPGASSVATSSDVHTPSSIYGGLTSTNDSSLSPYNSTINQTMGGGKFDQTSTSFFQFDSWSSYVKEDSTGSPNFSLQQHDTSEMEYLQYPR
ncbi:mitochondrial thioredoxin [Microbotryomycetes sp. JL221]|nr:mitochondrial thioredoxin [Microbotryomycetes sp. JL221]